jgi:hypothetical protein
MVGIKEPHFSATDFLTFIMVLHILTKHSIEEFFKNEGRKIMAHRQLPIGYAMLFIAWSSLSWGCSLLSLGTNSDDGNDENYTRPPLVFCDTPGEPCEDNNPCTVNPTCVGGVCFGQMMACKEGEECPDNACPFYYSSDSQVIEVVTDDEGSEYSVVASELIVALKEGRGRKEAIRLAEMANSRIVGQLPTYNLYLFKLGVSELGEMDQVMENLSSQDAVLYTSYNGVMESTDICQADSDNYNHSGPAKCPWLDTNYFQGLLLFDSVYRAYSDYTDLVETTHGPVRVAVIEAEEDEDGRKNHF